MEADANAAGFIIGNTTKKKVKNKSNKHVNKRNGRYRPQAITWHTVKLQKLDSKRQKYPDLVILIR